MTRNSNNKRRSKYSGKRMDYKDEKFESKNKATDKYGSQKCNDATWYFKHDQQAKDVASFSFNDAIGSVTKVTNDGNSRTMPFDLTLPGIMSIYTGPAVNPSNAPSSAINIAARDIYGYVRHDNSGHANYGSTDMMLYLMAMDSVYSMISYMQRLVGFCNVYSTTNRYVGDMMITAMGARPSEIRANLANFVAFLNQYVVKASAFCVPSSLNLYKRHFWMYSGVYKDDAVAKSQFYMYVPAYLWQYSVDLEGKGFLDPLPFICVPNASAGNIEARSVSVAEIQETANALLNQLQYSEDINIMSGDIKKAYKDEIWTMNLISPDFAVAPIYSEEILDQIHNTTFIGRIPCKEDGTASLDSMAIHQIVNTEASDPYLTFRPIVKRGQHLGFAKVIDIHDEAPTPEEVLVATRNCAIGKPFGSTTALQEARTHEIVSCGCDLCFFAIVHYLSNGQPATYQLYYEDSANTNLEAREQMLTKFNKYPTYYWFNDGAITLNTAPAGVGGEVDNYAVISHQSLKAMHENAMLALLDVPNASRVISK